MDLSVPTLWDRWPQRHSVSFDYDLLRGWSRSDPCYHELWNYVDLSVPTLCDNLLYRHSVSVDYHVLRGWVQ